MKLINIWLISESNYTNPPTAFRLFQKKKTMPGRT